MTDRTNDDWIRQLAEPGPVADAALADLRVLLRRGLGKALHGHAGADDAFLEDTTQDGMLKILDSASSFRGESKFTTWAITIAVRVALSELRRARWRDVSLDGLTEAGAAPAPTTHEATSTSMVRDEMITLMRRVMETDLSERQRFTLVAELNGVPQVELCDRLGLNRNALYKLGHDARKKLKSGLLAAGVTEDDVREVFAITS